MQDPLGAAPIAERVEFLSDGWIAAARARLESIVRTHRARLDGVEFSICETMTDAPPHLGWPGNVASWHFSIRDGVVEAGRGPDPAAQLQVEADYQKIMPIAQAVGPKAVARARRECVHLFGSDFLRVRGKPPDNPLLADLLSELHDYLARRTVENPELSHRIARLGLEKQINDIDERGYCVVERAITDEFNDEIRQVVLDEVAEQRQAAPPTGRVDTNGLIGRHRVFEEITQNLLLRTVIEHSLGPNAIFHTVGGCVMQPGKGAINAHVDYVTVPAPFPEYALVGVSVWAFDDWLSEAAGPTWIVPGSQRMRRHPRPDDDVSGAVPILMPKGSVTFFTQGVWHWQGDRTIQSPRVSMHNAYSRSFVRQADNYTNLDPAVLRRNSPVLSQLCGLDDYFGRTTYRGHDYERMMYMNRLYATERSWGSSARNGG